MACTRRDLAGLLAALAGDAAKAAPAGEIPSQSYPFDQLPVKKSGASGANETRNVFDGKCHAGCHVDLHLTTLPPGGAPHPPHRHEHDELVMVQEGTLEVMISGQTTRVGPGSVAYVHSNDFHGWKNVGDTRAQYFVMAIRQQSAT